jgi:SpoVK/Ycf46/Vps4 family AAA+-type ATPase
MLDYGLHKKYHPTSTSFFYTSNPTVERTDVFDPWPARLDRGQLVDEALLMVMPRTVDGFNFQTKTWGNCQPTLLPGCLTWANFNNPELLYVKNISKVEWYKTAFTRLVLPSRTKDLIRAMIVDRKVEAHSSDIFYGKGKGLIMLLHGAPGTGKTLSAESVAEVAEKPLHRVTCGDIGTEIDNVEQYLEMILSVGKRWDCVLLLDEADVFLEERSLADLKRNSLVSVFLRVLEYYEGILILTSNRVGIFDEAFKSRIQVALHYDNLPLVARKKIWANFFELLQEDQVEADFADLESHLEDLAMVDMNGRQIRNAVTTARQLARFRNETLEYEHIQSVIKTAGDFNRYIEKVHGHKDEKWARDGGLR